MFNELINKTSIRNQLFLTVAAGIIVLLAALIYASTWISDRQVRELLIEQGIQAAADLADNSRLALLYDSIDNASPAIASTLSFPDVNSVHIFKTDASLFYCSVEESSNHKHEFSAEQLASLSKAALLSENDSNWTFAAPVSTRSPDSQLEQELFSGQDNEQKPVIGYVVVSISKNSLKTIDRGILLSNLGIAIIIGLLILLILHKTIQRLTQPLRSLASFMKKTEEGEYSSRVDSNGPLEIHTIAHAYNHMISALAERDEKLRRQNLRLEKQAIHDHLTGLINRTGFEQGLHIALEECHTMDASHVLCYMDLDRFKIVNDSCGHNAGDELLKIISNIFSHHVRKDADLLARIGGDEFALILKNCSLEKARAIGENICEEVQNYQFEWYGRTFTVGVSIGITALNRESGGIQEATSLADQACYAAKAAGRGRVVVLGKDDEHKPGMRNTATDTKGSAA